MYNFVLRALAAAAAGLSKTASRMNLGNTTWYIIVNPHAGSGKTIHEWEVAEKKLAACSVPYVSVFTDHKYHAEELAYKAAGKGFRRFLAVGGDGSVHETLSGMMRWSGENGVPSEEFTLGVIPIGSGNDWIKSLNVPHDTEKVVQLLARESFTRQDVIKVTAAGGRVCTMANIGGTGFDSHVCARVNTQKEAGHRSARIYVNALFHTILNLKRFRAEIVCDGKTLYSGPCYSIAFGNGRYSGGGMKQTCDALIDDGLIDIMVVPVVSVFAILKEVRRVFDGTTSSSSRIIYSRAREIHVAPLDARSSDIVEMDGEIVGNLPLVLEATGQQVGVVCGRAK